MGSPSLWNKRTCLVLTGASRGIGQEIAVQFAKKVAENSLFILLARSAEGLQETKDKILNFGDKVEVKTFPTDLERPNEGVYKDLLTQAAGEVGRFELAVLVHNAGSLGDMSKYAAEMDDLGGLQSYFALNMFSVMLLNTAFLKVFPGGSGPERLVINITSLLALQPCKNSALYCCGKAAREMFFKVLGEEEPSVRVLNYSPGPVLTAMADALLAELRCEEVRTNFSELRAQGGYLTTAQTVARLVSVLDKNQFTQAQHLDYFDQD